MVDNSKEVRKQILDCIGCIAAIVTIVTYVLLKINNQWAFLDDSSFVYKVLRVIEEYAPLIVVGIVGWEFVADKSFIWRILFYASIALIVITMFFPSTWQQIVGFVNKS